MIATIFIIMLLILGASYGVEKLGNVAVGI